MEAKEKMRWLYIQQKRKTDEAFSTLQEAMAPIFEKDKRVEGTICHEEANRIAHAFEIYLALQCDMDDITNVAFDYYADYLNDEEKEDDVNNE